MEEDVLSFLDSEAARLDKEVLKLERQRSDKMMEIRDQRSVYKKVTSERRQAQVIQQEKADFVDALAHWSDPELELPTSTRQPLINETAPIIAEAAPIMSTGEPIQLSPSLDVSSAQLGLSDREMGEYQFDSPSHRAHDLHYHTLEAAPPTMEQPPAPPDSARSPPSCLRPQVRTAGSTILDPLELLWRASKESEQEEYTLCLLYTSPSPRDKTQARKPSYA